MSLMKPPFISGFAFSGYRSFWGSELQYVGRMSKVHLIVGQNNSGKSNILRFAQTYLPAIRKLEQISSPSGIDLPAGPAVSTDFKVRLAFDYAIEDISQAVFGNEYSAIGDRARFLLESTFFKASPFLHEGAGVWLTLAYRNGGSTGVLGIDATQIEAVATSDQPSIPREGVASTTWADVASSDSMSRGRREQQISELSKAIAKLEPFRLVPPVQTIPAFRQIKAGEKDGQYMPNGEGLIHQLAKLQQPQQEVYDESRRRFESINRFLQLVIDNATASIRIPAEQDRILVEMNGRVLDLDSLGTGVHQVIILAAAATLIENTLVCMEEPEVHLHPILQRRLIRYLNEETSNQYLVATHSAQLLDSGIASISHIRLGEAGTEVETAVRPAQIARIARDLGYRASDIVQSNCVIWVEGPSDRIYIKHWLHLQDPLLNENIHYSIMFYGGSLLKHLSPTDDEVGDFINLPRLNRNLVVVIDSDKTSRGMKLNETKVSVRDAFNDGEANTGHAWITSGYTIENYIPANLLSQAVTAVHPRARPVWNGEQFSNPLEARPMGRDATPNKTSIAKEVVRTWPKEVPMPLNLRREIVKICTWIRDANDLPLKT